LGFFEVFFEVTFRNQSLNLYCRWRGAYLLWLDQFLPCSTANIMKAIKGMESRDPNPPRETVTIHQPWPSDRAAAKVRGVEGERG